MKLNKKLLLSISKNKRYINRYFKLIEAYINKQSEIQGNSEKHHILPRCLFEEYIESDWNIIKIPSRVHYIAHFLLYKADIDSKLTYAFNMMNVTRTYQEDRITSRLLNHSKLYEKFKNDMIVAIKLSNTGKLTVLDKHTNEKIRVSSTEYKTNKDKYIHPNAGNILIIDELGNLTTIKQELFDKDIHKTPSKGITTVKDSDGNKFNISITDDRYLRGEFKSIQHGMLSVKNLIDEMCYITSEEYSNNKDKYIHHSTNQVCVKNENNEIIILTSEEYKNSNYIFHTKNKVTVKDKDGNGFRVSTTDERYLSGELVPVSKGLKWYYNPLTLDKGLYNEGKEPLNYIRGMRPKLFS